MQSDLKVVLVVFGEVSSVSSSGIKLFHYRLAKALYDNNSLESILCVNASNETDFLQNQVISIYQNLILKLVFKIIDKLNFYFPSRYFRLFKERVFDAYFSRRKYFEDVNVIICTKPVTPNILETTAPNIKKYIITTIAHPVFIQGQIKRIEKEFGVTDHSSYTNKKRIKRIERTLAAADLVIPRINSPFINQTYLDNRITKINSTLIPEDCRFNLDLDKYQARLPREAADQALTFLTAGFFNLKKGIPILLRAWQELYDEGKIIDSTLILAGPLDKSTAHYIKKMSLKSVKFIGRSPDLIKIYQKSDVFIASSISDLGPRTIMEAMACGLPTIASNHCGMADFIDHEINGFKYDPWDITELKDKILWFIEHRVSINEMGLNARKKVEESESYDFAQQLMIGIKKRNLI